MKTEIFFLMVRRLFGHEMSNEDLEVVIYDWKITKIVY